MHGQARHSGPDNRTDKDARHGENGQYRDAMPENGETRGEGTALRSNLSGASEYRSARDPGVGGGMEDRGPERWYGQASNSHAPKEHSGLPPVIRHEKYQVHRE